MSHRRALLPSFASFASFVLVVAGGLSGASIAHAGGPHRDAAFEEKVTRELQARAPEAVPVFQQAVAASDAGQTLSALDSYSRVLELAPGFSHAERRKCSVLVQLGRRSEALPYCRAALAQEASAPNEAALAAALLSVQGGAPDKDAAEAYALALEATKAERALRLERTRSIGLRHARPRGGGAGERPAPTARPGRAHEQPVRGSLRRAEG